MTHPWQRVKDVKLEEQYVRLEKLIDNFLALGANKVVQQIEKERMVAEGSLTNMTLLCDTYGAELIILRSKDGTA